jgi:DNA-directed RNA polymerase subunit RPC12/RpoP
MEPEDRTVEQLLQALHVTIPFGIETGRVTAISSADLPHLIREVSEGEDVSPSRKYFAQSGLRQLTITKSQMEALIIAGAPGKDVGVLRSFKNAEQVTFSNHCPACGRWIHLGSTEHEGQCFCGQSYRVVFDLSPDDWSLRQDLRCMDCGVELTMSLVESGLNPWHPINGHQVQCDACALKRLSSQAAESARNRP